MRPLADSPPHSLDDYRWLVGPAGQAVLAAAATLPAELTARAERLRSTLSPARTSLVLGQLELRQRAGDKFAAAARMFFTAKGLEQASDELVASYKATRFPAGKPLLDLCTGIGGDLLALARRGTASGVDRDPVCAVLAEANGRAVLAPAELPRVVVGAAADAALEQFAAWHIDPDRRPRGPRTTRAELHEPPADAIERLLGRNPHAAVKLAPASVFPESWTARAELEWIGRARSCRQLVAWFGDLAHSPGRRRATVLNSQGSPARSIFGLPGEEPPIADEVGSYLFEPDSAVLAARLTAALAGEHELAAVAPGIAYLTGPVPVADAALSCFAVDDVLPFDLKRVRAWLGARNVGRLEIKVRGVDQDPRVLARRLRGAGDGAATLLVTRLERGVVAILARRVVQ